MNRWLGLRWLAVLAVFLPVLAGCGGSDEGDGPVFIEPGLVEIDDRPNVALTAPELTVEYVLPGVPGTFVASLLSHHPSDGDIAFDPVADSFEIAQGADTLLFGIDSARPDRPEFRAFLDFPLDGSTGGAVIPLEAAILSADLTVFVNFVDFAGTVPVLLDLVRYAVPSRLTADDYFSIPLAVRAFDLFHADAGRDVTIDVTALMRETQARGLADFQVRFLLRP